MRWVWERKTFASDLKDVNKFEEKLAKEIYRDFYTVLGWNSEKKLKFKKKKIPKDEIYQTMEQSPVKSSESWSYIIQMLHMVSYLHCQQKAFPLKKLLLYMCVKHSTFRKVKDNIHFFTCSMFLVIFLLLGTLVLLSACLFVLFCFYAGGRQKNRKMQSVHNTEFQKWFFSSFRE